MLSTLISAPTDADRKAFSSVVGEQSQASKPIGCVTKYSSEGQREWLSVTATFPTEAEAKTFIRTEIERLRGMGWLVNSHRYSNRFSEGGMYFSATVCAERGHGPNTKFEDQMISVCTGRD